MSDPVKGTADLAAAFVTVGTLLVGFRALYAIQTNEAWSTSLRRADDTQATLTAVQFVRLLALMGDRITARLGQRDTRLNQLAAATAEQLKGFAP